MVWFWYPVKDVDKVMLQDVPDEIIELELEGLQTETVRFIRSFSVGIIFRGFLLFPNMNNRNPFTKNNEVGAMIHDGKYWIGVNEDSL